MENLAKILQNNNFSITIDESTDISTINVWISNLVLLCTKMESTRDRFLTMIELMNVDAKKNIIEFASDNTSVMMVERGGVRAYFEIKQKFI